MRWHLVRYFSYLYRKAPGCGTAAHMSGSSLRANPGNRLVAHTSAREAALYVLIHTAHCTTRYKAAKALRSWWRP